ncbi:MAG: polyhydroxybutyrate depolymerase, partial [Pseudomonadota bacterium]
WKRQGTLIVRHDRIASGTRSRGVLLLAPNGENATWDFWRPGSPDSVFARAVIDDAAARYPIDREQIFVSGYSFGANMAWRFACEDGADLRAMLAISGALSQFEKCTTAPQEVRQVFGLDDQVLPFPMGQDGDETYPVQLWRTLLGCEEGRAAGPWSAREFLTFERTVWDCSSGRVTLDVHPAGHFIPHDWIATQLDQLLVATN